MLTDSEVTHSWVELMPYPFHSECEECAVEAWERMAYGGLNGAFAVDYHSWSGSIGADIYYNDGSGARWAHNNRRYLAPRR